MITLDEKVYGEQIPRDKKLVLACDIGGTNSNFGVCAVDTDTVELVLSVHAKSNEIDEFTQLVNHVLIHFHSNYELELKVACFAAAGVVSEDGIECKPTNLPFTINVKEIIERTALEHAVIINDFQAVGYGVDYLDQDALKKIHEGRARSKANRAIIGAGTGLGKTILVWDETQSHYKPIPSEGGHVDFAPYNEREFAFMQFVQQAIDPAFPVSCENVLSGQGIIRIYTYLGMINDYPTTAHTQEIEKNGVHPDLVFKYRADDERCRDTFNWYRIFYARAAKNFALNALALGGLYIAGGIAAQNLPLFEHNDFMDEFIRCKKQQQLLEEIPVYVITDYNVSLFGAAAFLRRYVNYR